MSAVRTLSDIEINALADGELSGEAAAEARLAVAAGDEAQRAALAWPQELSGQLHLAYDGALAEALPSRTARLFRPALSLPLPKGIRRFAAAAAIAAAAAGAGYLAGMQSVGGDAQGPGFVQAALGAHKVYASEVRHPVEVAGTDSEHLGKWLSKRLGADFEVPQIKDAGFTLVGGRLLAEAARPAALLMYEDGNGRRVTLYIEKGQGAAESAMRHAASGALDAYYWTNGALACALTGELDDAGLKLVAKTVYAALDRG